MMFLLTCDKKLTISQFSSTHAYTKRKITDELKQHRVVYVVREGSPVRWVGDDLWWEGFVEHGLFICVCLYYLAVVWWSVTLIA